MSQQKPNNSKFFPPDPSVFVAPTIGVPKNESKDTPNPKQFTTEPVGSGTQMVYEVNKFPEPVGSGAGEVQSDEPPTLTPSRL